MTPKTKTTLRNLLWVVGSLVACWGIFQLLPAYSNLCIVLHAVAAIAIAWVNIRHLSSKVRQVYFGTVITLYSLYWMFFKFDIITELLDLDYYPYKEFLMVYTAILVLFVLAASLLRCLCTPKDSSSPAARNYLFASLLLLTFTAAAPNMIGYKLNYLAVNSEEGYIVCDQLPASDKYARRLIVNSEHGVDTLYVSNPKFWYEDYYYRVGSANDSWLYRLCRRYLDHKYQTMEE